MAGGWEFPGGKVEADEQALAALKRELREELGIEVLDAEPLIAYEHEYPERRVLLDLWRVSLYTGEPSSVEGQPLQWVSIDELEAVGLLEADRPMIPALRTARR